MKKTAKAVKPHLSGKAGSMGNSKPRPETEAFRFYLLQHAMAEIRQRFELRETLPDLELDIAERYHLECNQLAVRMFYYLILICTREARHVPGNSVWFNKVRKEFGKDVAHFLEHLPGGSDHAAMQFCDNPATTNLGNYTKSLSYTFHKGNWGSSPSFGGPKWGNVADCLNRFVWGELSAEMMLDTAFTLAHNGGPIFNKGMLFKTHSGSPLLMILDAQASGQIPQLILEADLHPEIKDYASKEIRILHELCTAALGKPMKGEVDWFKVSAMGKNNWGSKKKAQGGKSSKFAKAELEAAKQAAKIANAAKWKLSAKMGFEKITRAQVHA
jgi:hypothetical protein